MQHIFAPGADEHIDLDEQWWDGEKLVQGRRPLRLQQKNWRLAGTAVRGARFERVRPDDIVLLWFRRQSATRPWTVTWDVLSQRDAQTASVFAMAREHLGAGSAALLDDKARELLLGACRRRLRAFGGDPSADTGDLTDADWQHTVAWLREHLTIQKLRGLLRSDRSGDVDALLDALGTRGRDSERDLAEEVVRRFGSDLLTDAVRRDKLCKARFPESSARPEFPGNWRRGSPSALRFALALGLPASMAGTACERPEDFEDVDAFRPLGKLHEYQQTIARGIAELLHADAWEKRRAIAWLPTGTGKTRVTVETLLMECALEAPRNCLLWVADREELCEQAVETFRHVWMVRGRESKVAAGTHPPPLRIIRLWGSRKWQEPPLHPTVIVASIQTLSTRLEEQGESFAEELAILGERTAAVVFDEAHHVIASSYTRVIRALGLDRLKNYLGRDHTSAPPLLGLTATPARTSEDETERLSQRFGGRLIEPAAEFRSLDGFQRQGYLSKVRYVKVDTRQVFDLNEREREHYARFKMIPTSTLKQIGGVTDRTEVILRDLESRLRTYGSVLVFACSVEHAHTISEVLARRGHRAAALDGTSPRPVRWRTIQRFREGGLQVLVNCDLLATGFDAPNVDAVVLARPVESRILYAQMIGRGLRGPRNGGTETCTVIDYQDRFERLPTLDQLREEFRETFLAARR